MIKVISEYHYLFREYMIYSFLKEFYNFTANYIVYQRRDIKFVIKTIIFMMIYHTIELKLIRN